VIQDLFIAGLALQGAMRSRPDSATEERIAAATAQLDHAITLIRSSVIDNEVSAAAPRGSRSSGLEITTA